MPLNTETIVRDYLKEYRRKWCGETLEPTREHIALIKWQPPPDGWTKMNVDGSFLEEWIMGFSFNLEAQCQLETEIKAIREGIINNVGERIGDQAPNCGE